MSNIKNYIFNKFDLNVSDSKNWDFYLVSDNYADTDVNDSCLTASFDFNNSNIFVNSEIKKIKSLSSWLGSINTGYTFDTIGLTGIDNGLIPFDSTIDVVTDVLTGSTLVIPSGDTQLYLNGVSGSSSISYGMNLVSTASTIGNYINLNGGFYQGYYKIDGSSYQVLPNRMNHGWTMSMWIKKSAYTSGNTLNDLYPDNRGLFFYMGTRAENKFWNKFSGETNISVASDYDGIVIPLNPPRVEIDLIMNTFLIYGRAKNGSGDCMSCGGNDDGLGTKTVCTYDGKGVVVTKFKDVVTNKNNPFLIYGRAKGSGEGNCLTCGGNHDGFGTETACSFSGFTSLEERIDYNLDIIDNAIGFRIKDDGSIGYRLLSVTGSCSGDVYTSGLTIEEAYSKDSIIADDKWTYITVRYSANGYLDDCELETAKPRKGSLSFYVDGRLVFVVNDFNEFIARRLEEYKSKQVGVPFNISIGGGSQGLIETQTFNGPDTSDLGLPIEKNFAGSFVGGISQFNLYNCDLNYVQIKQLYEDTKNRYA
jgi:hypothetical protein